MAAAKQVETRDGVELTNLDQPLFSGSESTKRDLVDYLDAVAEPLLRELAGRPLTVTRVRPGQRPFVQKNLPDHTPDHVSSTTVWSASGHRDIRYALCEDRRTLLWFANQRAVEYHPTVVLPPAGERTEVLAGEVTHLVLDLDPPEGGTFDAVVATARLVRRALVDVGLAGALKTSGSTGLHVVVPVVGISIEDAAAATRALADRAAALDDAVATTAYIKADRGGRVFVDATRAGGASLAAAYSPRVRPGATVSWPVPWEDLDRLDPGAFTVRTAAALLDGDPWAELLPARQHVPGDVVEHGRTIPVARVAAMHEGKRRKREAQRRERDG